MVVEGEESWAVDEHTFSNPKKRSLPSSRNGPAFCSIFSNGVSSGAASSFFFGDASLAVCTAEGYMSSRHFVSNWNTLARATPWQRAVASEH